MNPSALPETRTFLGALPGPRLLVLGAIHGDEPCGPLAIGRIIEEIESGALTLARGTLACIAVANPEAQARNARFVEENLNRIFKEWPEPSSYEQRLANVLAQEVRDCDYLLDIHSMTAKSEPTVFVDFPTPENRALAQVLGMRYAILGWPELYADSAYLASYDTTQYAHAVGKPGVLIECGQHEDPEAAEVAYRALRAALMHLSMIEGAAEPLPLASVRMRELYIKRSDEDAFPRDWRHLDPFEKGDVLASTPAGDIVAGFDGVMLLPKKGHPVGTEWFYTGAWAD
jgi:predicted deacylase